MQVRDKLWACMEMSTSEHHDKTIPEQIATPGEKARVVALARCMPKSLIGRLVAWRKIDYAPVRSDASISQKPIGYGGESLVYNLDHGGSKSVFKIEHSKFPLEQQIEQLVAHYKLYRHYFGDIVVPTSYMICESPYGSGKPVVASVQRKIEGEPISDVDCRIDQADLGRVLDGAARMIDEQDLAPDFGLSNLHVDQEGHIHLIDTGYVMPMADLDMPAYRATIGYLESLRTEDLQIAV